PQRPNSVVHDILGRVAHRQGSPRYLYRSGHWRALSFVAILRAWEEAVARISAVNLGEVGESDRLHNVSWRVLILENNDLHIVAPSRKRPEERTLQVQACDVLRCVRLAIGDQR